MKFIYGLHQFIDKAIVNSKRNRVLGFTSSPKKFHKFANLLNHEFLNILDHTKFIPPFDINASKQSGFLICSNGVFNECEKGFSELYGKAPWEGGWLIINSSGNYAIYRPEGKIDNEVYIGR